MKIKIQRQTNKQEKQQQQQNKQAKQQLDRCLTRGIHNENVEILTD